GKAAAFIEYLDKTLGFEGWLEDTAEQQNEDGFTDSAEQTRQLASVAESTAEQIVQLLGSEKVSAEEFRDTFMDALKDVKIGVLPQAEGRVQIGSAKRSIIQDKKAVFLATFCDGSIPSSPGSSGVLTEKEINSLAGKGTPLSKPSDLLISEELFMLFRSASCARELLWAGLPSSDLEGGELTPSPALPMLKERYPNVRELRDAESSGDTSVFIEGSRLPLEKLSIAVRDGLSGEEIPELWKAVYNELAQGAPQVKAGLLFDPSEPPLDKKLAEKLFSGADGAKSLSPSRLDLFAACPFKHFITYGLRPVEDADFTISGREMGDILHEALLRLSEKLSAVSAEKGLDITDPESLWMTVGEDEVDAMLKEILADMAENSMGGLMQSSGEEIYRSERILDSCSRFARHMIYQVRAGNIKRMYFETPFRRDRGFGPVKLETAAGTVYVEGKIDRVDILPGADGKEYIKIIDYKSGKDKFSRELVEEGLKMQLMTYLEGASGGGGSPAGVYYFRINADDLEASMEDLLSDELSEKVVKSIEKEYRLDGITVSG
ncbi:MAG: PD-(D/E)XK nuclease family protein, partial [Firmicutes bacterium]|nr:PD-(D/E)XK nuclease family protein [Bacillota bacterium]